MYEQQKHLFNFVCRPRFFLGMGLQPNLDIFPMNREDIIRMALESEVLSKYESPTGFCAEAAVKFADLVASAEREACAKVCENQADDQTEGEWDGCCLTLAKHIRARGQA